MCGKLLFKGVIRTTLIEIKCKRCSALSAFGPKDREEKLGRYGLIVAKDGTIMAVSDTVTKILGYSPEELRSINIRDLHAYGRSGPESPFVDGAVVDEQHRGKDGTSVTVRVRHEYAGSDSGSRLYLCDVHPQPVLNDAPAGLTVHALTVEIDSGLRVRHVSDAFARLIGRSAQQLIGSDLLELLDADAALKYGSFYASAHATLVPFVLEGIRIEGAPGSLVFRAHTVPSCRDDGAFRGYTLIFEQA